MLSQRGTRRLTRYSLCALYATSLAGAFSLTVAAEQPPSPPTGTPPALTAADYARAEKFMTYNATPLVLHGGVRATWLPDDRFWYRTMTERGREALLVDPVGATRSPCDLPACRDRAADAAPGEGRAHPLPNDVRSPDGKRTVFIRDWNLWVRDIATGAETPLTTDGVVN